MVCFNLSYKGILWLLLSIGNWDFSYYKILTEKLYHHCRMFTVGIMRDGTVGMISDGSSFQFKMRWFVQNLTAAVPTAWLKVKVQLQALKWCSFNSKIHHNKAMCRTHPATLLAQCQGHSWRSNVFTVLIPYLSKRFYVYLNKAAGKYHVLAAIQGQGHHWRSSIRLSTLNSLPKALERFSLSSNAQLNKVICRIHSAAVLSKDQCNP